MKCAVCGVDLPVQARGRPRRYCSTECRQEAGRRGAWPSRFCRAQRCSHFARRDGLCGCHLSKRRRSEGLWTMRDQILDWLSLDGGWLTAHSLADELDRNLDATERVLRKLRSEGLVESQVVELAGFHVRDRRTEWRVT